VWSFSGGTTLSLPLPRNEEFLFILMILLFDMLSRVVFNASMLGVTLVPSMSILFVAGASLSSPVYSLS
jgi:hypothetical protein